MAVSAAIFTTSVSMTPKILARDTTKWLGSCNLSPPAESERSPAVHHIEQSVPGFLPTLHRILHCSAMI